MKNNYLIKACGVLLIASMLLSGCNPATNETSDTSNDTSVTTAEVTKATEPEPTIPPTPTPTPPINHSIHEGVKEYKALKDMKQAITGIAVLPTGDIVVGTRDDFVNGEYKSNKKGHVTIRVIDAKEDKLIAKYNTKAEDTTILGTTPDGKIIVNNYVKGNVTLMNRDLTDIQEIATLGTYCVYDQEYNRIVYIDNSELCYMDLAGNVESKCKKMFTSDLSGYNGKQGVALITDNDQSQDSVTELSLLNVEGQESFVVKSDDNYADMGFCGKNVFLSYPFSKDGMLDIRNCEDGQRLASYEIPAESVIMSSDLCDLALITVPGKQTYNYTKRKILVADLATGKYCDTGITFNDSYAMHGYYDKETEHYFVTGTVQEKGCKARLIEICPESYALTEQFENTVIPQAKPAGEKGQAGSHLANLRARADKLEEQYGIEIYLGNEIKGRDISYAYNLQSIEESDKSESEQVEVTSLELDKLEEGLKYYDKEFFERFRDYRGRGGLYLVLVDELKNENGDFIASGEFVFRGPISYIVIDIDYTDDITLHHELWHAVENNIVLQDKDAFAPEKWDKLNPPGFKYGDDFEHYYDYDHYEYVLDGYFDGTTKEAYFGRVYGTVNEREDRATVVESFVGGVPNYDKEKYSSALEALSQYPHFKAKIDYIEEVLMRVYGEVYWR